jgi:hypothetical protein
MDVFVFGQLREHGVSLKTLRRVYQRLRDDIGKPHPFAHQRLTTDGREVFLRVAGREGQDELIEVLNRQRVMPEIIEPSERGALVQSGLRFFCFGKAWFRMTTHEQAWKFLGEWPKIVETATNHRSKVFEIEGVN